MLKKAVIAAVAVVILLPILFVGCKSYFERQTVTTKVISNDRVCNSVDAGNGVDCKYLIFTEAGTFKVVDSLAIMRMDSSDVYGRVREGHTYEITYYGWRIPLASEYPNIVELKETERD